MAVQMYLYDCIMYKTVQIHSKDPLNINYDDASELEHHKKIGNFFFFFSNWMYLLQLTSDLSTMEL